MVLAVRGLVQSDAERQLTAECMQAAQESVAANPHGTLQRIVDHFQRLFDVPYVMLLLTTVCNNLPVPRSMEAVIPCINRLHMVSSTHTNMLRTLGHALGLGDSVTPAAITGAVRTLLHQHDHTYACLRLNGPLLARNVPPQI